MAPTYKIAVVQLHPEALAVKINYAKAVGFIRDAARQGCHLVVLPEYHLTSWVPEAKYHRASHSVLELTDCKDPDFMSACADWQTYVDKYCELAKELKINIVPGTIVEKHDAQLLNVAYFISDAGEILGTYQKKNLWHPEREHLTSSAHAPHVAFDTPIGKVGMLICWDLAFPEAFRALIAAGARTIIIPTFWNLEDCNAEGLAYNPLSEALFLESTLVARAFENTCMLVFSNGGGAGLSQVAVPFRGALGKMGQEEGSTVVDVDMQILDVAEANYKVREDMAKQGWHYEYTLAQ
ncbi:Nitrilase [Phlyctema vagabunda]|uniref:Nitrilase n=1 Tax=Phlyctema vagabunda TaxID=108571 RepID=A0ABR4PF86_9HELO